MDVNDAVAFIAQLVINARSMSRDTIGKKSPSVLGLDPSGNKIDTNIPDLSIRTCLVSRRKSWNDFSQAVGSFGMSEGIKNIM